MKINDAVTGAALVALGLVILWHIQGYPEMQGQKFGPAWFPGIVAAGLAVCGAILVARGVRSHARRSRNPVRWKPSGLESTT